VVVDPWVVAFEGIFPANRKTAEQVLKEHKIPYRIKKHPVTGGVGMINIEVPEYYRTRASSILDEAMNTW
jgi:hypothetical protein